MRLAAFSVKLAATGVLVKAIEPSSFPTIVFFDDADATILLLTEEGKAASSRERPNDAQTSTLPTTSTRQEDLPPSSTSSSQEPTLIADSKRLSEDKSSRDAPLALTNLRQDFVDSHAAKAASSDALLPALARLSNKSFYLKASPQLLDDPHKKDHPTLSTLRLPCGVDEVGWSFLWGSSSS